MRESLKTAAIAGTALAAGVAATAGADQMIGGEDIRDGSLKLKDLSDAARNELKGNRGPRGRRGRRGLTGLTGPAGPAGPQGAQGATGSQGAEGPAGPAGAAASSAFLLGGTVRVPSPGKVAAPDFAPVIGGRPLRNQIGDVEIPAPDDVSAARGLRVRLSDPLPWDVTAALYVEGTASSGVTCQIVSGDTTCDAPAGSEPVAPGQLLALGITSDAKGGKGGKGKGGGPTLNFSMVLEK